jgi:hypothetical protein
MSSKIETVVFASIAALLVGGVAWAVAADGGPPSSSSACSAATPPKLAAPAGNDLAFELLANGVQIYSCVSPGGASGGPAWALQAPEATLTDQLGRRAGTHRAGPTWEALDGSSVVGAKVEAATSDPAAVPWLLLRAASHEGRGLMADITFVQRIQTSGGVAPSEGCSAATVGAVARVPYRAVYCFYRSHGMRSDAEKSTSGSSSSPRL